MRTDEHIDNRGHLRVPVARWIDPAPKRVGWKPFFVNVNLDRDPVKVYSYRRTGERTFAAEEALPTFAEAFEQR